MCSLLLSQAYIEKEDSKKLKQKQREKMQPKMGKMDIDYQVTSNSVCWLMASQTWHFWMRVVSAVLLHFS